MWNEKIICTTFRNQEQKQRWLILTCVCACVRRLLEEESTKRAELEQHHLRQQRAITETEAEKQELEKERQAKESALQTAMAQLEHLEKERQGALEQYQVSLTQEQPGMKLQRR